MNRGGADGVVDLELVEKENREHNDYACDGADYHRAAYAYIGAAARYRDKACEAAVNGHAEIGLADEYPRGCGCRKHCHYCGGVGRHHDVSDIGGVLEAHCRAGVETEPAQPQYEKAYNGKGHIVSRYGAGLALFVVLAVAGAEYYGARESRPAAHRVNDGVAREIKKAKLGEPSAAPNPVAYYGVNNQRKHKGEYYKRNVLYALGDSARNDGCRRAAEYQLEEELAPERHAGSKGVVIEREVGVAKDKQMFCADKRVVAAEHQAPAEKQKAEGRHRENDKVLGQYIDGVFRPREARLDGGEAEVHKKHQYCRKRDP